MFGDKKSSSTGGHRQEMPMQGIATAGNATSSIFVTESASRVSDLGPLAASIRCCVALLAADSARLASLRNGLSLGMCGEVHSTPLLHDPDFANCTQ